MQSAGFCHLFRGSLAAFTFQRRHNLAQWDGCAAVDAFATPRFCTPTGRRCHHLRPPRIGAALRRAHRVDAATSICFEKHATAVSQAQAFSRVVHAREVTPPEPGAGNIQKGAYAFLFLRAGFDITAGVASAAHAATGAFKTQGGGCVEIDTHAQCPGKVAALFIKPAGDASPTRASGRFQACHKALSGCRPCSLVEASGKRW